MRIVYTGLAIVGGMILGCCFGVIATIMLQWPFHFIVLLLEDFGIPLGISGPVLSGLNAIVLVACPIVEDMFALNYSKRQTSRRAGTP